MTAGTLIMLGDHHGSLAAARSLGRRGVPVTFADARGFNPGAWSRFVRRRVASPSPTDLTAYAAWLAAFGQTQEGLFLYPVSDDLCWILSKHRDSLTQHYRMYQPSLDTIYTLLNKQRLHSVAARLGVACPRTWAPESDEALAQMVADIEFPVLIKPRTQIGLDSKRKGRVCRTADELLVEYRAFRAANHYHAEVVAHDPVVDWPLVQEFIPTAASDIYSLAGFCDQDGHVAFRASQKVFQRPRNLGVGVGFEARPLDDEAVHAVTILSRAIGYYGAFEAEFVRDPQGGLLLVDFNPRYYGQMAFEVARGLDLPWLAWLGAHGARADLATALGEAAGQHASTLATRSRYAYSWMVRLLVTTQFISGRLSRSERRDWLWWLTDGSVMRFDAMSDGDDPRPFWVDLANTTYHFARHPRAFVRQFCFDE